VHSIKFAVMKKNAHKCITEILKRFNFLDDLNVTFFITKFIPEHTSSSCNNVIKLITHPRRCRGTVVIVGAVSLKFGQF